MACRSILVCDFSGNEIPAPGAERAITIRFGDGRRGVVVGDADDPIIAEGRQQARCGAPPKAESG